MSFTLQPLYIRGKKSLHPDSRRQGGLLSGPEGVEMMKRILYMLAVERRFLGRPLHSLNTVPSELSLLVYVDCTHLSMFSSVPPVNFSTVPPVDLRTLSTAALECCIFTVNVCTHTIRR